jgi:hypothetical protein
MRGSPLFRTFLVLLALVGAGLGIRHLADAPVPPPSAPSPGPATVESTTAPFFLTFSSPPAELRLECAGNEVVIEPEGVTATGTLELSGERPTIFITIRWADPDPAKPHFAKLTLEPADHPTLTRTFDGFGGIDDAWELHLKP